MRTLHMNELPYDAYSSLVEIFGEETIQQLRKDFKDNCLGLAQCIKNTFNSQGYMAEVITFKNGNAFSDSGIKVIPNQNTVYTHHAVVLMGEWVIDLLHSNNIIKIKDYILELQKYNTKLRIDYTLSTGWYTQDGFPYNPSLEDLKKYNIRKECLPHEQSKIRPKVYEYYALSVHKATGQEATHSYH